MRIRTRVRTACLIAGSALLLTACTEDEGAVSSAGPTVTSTAAPSTAIALAERYQRAGGEKTVYAIQQEADPEGAPLLILRSTRSESGNSLFEKQRDSVVSYLREFEQLSTAKGYRMDVFGPDGSLLHRWDAAPKGCHGEVVQGGDGVVEAIVFLAAVAEDLPVPHAGDGVLDAGANASVFGVALLLPAKEGASNSSAVRDDKPGTKGGAVRDDCRPGGVGWQIRLAPDVGVGLVAGSGACARDDQAAVRVDDDLHVRREPVVPGRGGDRVVRLQCQQRPEPLDDPADGG